MSHTHTEARTDWQELQEGVTDKARRRLAERSQDAEELKRIGLMLGLFAPDELDPTKCVKASPYQPDPSIAPYEVSTRLINGLTS